MNYDGPRIKKKYFKKPFCQNFKPMNGFVKARFIDVADGDTAFFDVSGCNECVRFMVVNCPKCDEIANSFENYGKEAKEYVKNILLCAKEIYLESDINNNLRDDTLTQRLLAWIWVDGMLLNYLIVRNGYGDNKYIINNKMKYLSQMKKAIKLASKEKLGLFKK